MSNRSLPFSFSSLETIKDNYILRKVLFNVILIVFFFAIISNVTAESYCSFMLKTLTPISQPLLVLDSNSTYTILKGKYNTSALVTVQATVSIPSNYSDVLRIISSYSGSLEVNLEVYSYNNLTRISNATIRLRNSTNSVFDQIIVKNGNLTQSKPNIPYELSPSETLYIDVINLQANATGTTYVYTRLRIRIPNKTTFILYTITFKFT